MGHIDDVDVIFVELQSFEANYCDYRINAVAEYLDPSHSLFRRGFL